MNNRNLFLIFHGRFPSEKAASLFAAKSAEAFSTHNISVSLIVPRRGGAINEDPYSYYNVQRIFKIIYLGTLDLFKIHFFKGISFLVSYLFFSISTFFYLKKVSKDSDIIYSNEILPLFLISFIRKNCFYEMHDFPESKLWIFGMFLRRMKWILVHNKWKLNEALRIFPRISQKKYVHEMNAVELSSFDISISKDSARDILALPHDKKIVVYTGHLYAWKGVYTLAESANYLPDNFLLVFVGGTHEDIEKFKKIYSNNKKIYIAGHTTHDKIPIWQKAADVLVLPNTAKEKISALYTSPMKLFEYIASKRPIVATDIPSIREILNETNAIIVRPDDEKDIASGIKRAIEDTDKNNMKTEKAFQSVLTHTWDKRAERIITFINK